MDGLLFNLFPRYVLTDSLFRLQRSYNILFNNITTYSDAKLLEMNATVRPNNQTADLYINVHNVLPLHNITFEILISPPSENGYTTLLKRSMTICEFTMGKYVDPIVKLIYDEFKKINVQFLSKCPIPVVRRTI